jgi:hypothetical protein
MDRQNMLTVYIKVIRMHENMEADERSEDVVWRPYSRPCYHSAKMNALYKPYFIKQTQILEE